MEYQTYLPKSLKTNVPPTLLCSFNYELLKSDLKNTYVIVKIKNLLQRQNTAKAALAILWLRFKVNLFRGVFLDRRFILNLAIFINQSSHKSLINLM